MCKRSSNGGIWKILVVSVEFFQKLFVEIIVDVKQFLAENYRSTAMFDLVEQSDVRRSLSEAVDASDLLLRISLASDVELVEHETAIFIDDLCVAEQRDVRIV